MVKVCKSFESMDNVRLLYVTDSCKTQKMCNKAVEKNPVMIRHVATCFITQQMFENVILVEVGLLNFIPKQFKTQHIVILPLAKFFVENDLFLIPLKLNKCCH